MKRVMLAAAGVAVLLGASATAAQGDTFDVTLEAPGMVNTSMDLTYGGVETFNERPLGAQTFKTDFGTDGAVTGAYRNVAVVSADEFGGAGGSGAYADADYARSYTLTVDATSSKGVNYFGFYATAVDVANTVTLSDNGKVLDTINIAAITPTKSAAPGYYGNTSWWNNDSGEAFEFVNIIDTTGKFNQITFSEPSSYGYGANFESDNHTVGHVAMNGGVPEPAAWTMMILGVSVVGVAARRRRRSISRLGQAA